jgi:hypothetical protein
MNKFNVMLLVVAALYGVSLQAGKVANGILTVDTTLNKFIDVVEPLADTAGGTYKIKYYSTYKPKLNDLTGVVKGVYNVALNVENFVEIDLDKIKATAEKLKRQFACLHSGTGCDVLGCKDKVKCVASILKSTKELLLPVITQLVASGKKDDKGNLVFNNGALYNLVNLPGMPTVVKTKIGTNVAEFTAKMMAALAFIDTLSFILNPVIEVPTDLTPEEKEKVEKQLEAEKKKLEAEPIVINMTEGDDFPSLD